jgi:hypothetical protein
MKPGLNKYESTDYLTLGKLTAAKYVTKTKKQENNLTLYNNKITLRNIENKITGVNNERFKNIEQMMQNMTESTRKSFLAMSKRISDNIALVSGKFEDYNTRVKYTMINNTSVEIRRDQLNQHYIQRMMNISSLQKQLMDIQVFLNNEIREDDRTKLEIQMYSELTGLIDSKITEFTRKAIDEFFNLTEKTDEITEEMLRISDQFVNLEITYR